MDSYYASALEVMPNLDLKRAGFINQPATPFVSKQPPVFKLILRKDVTNLILVNTGCYAPVHEGHVAMMNQAKTALVKEGYYVAGGYLVPAHDEYIKEKAGEDTPYTLSCRLAYLKDILKNHWCMVDSWIGIQAGDMNFTTYMEQLKLSLECMYPEHAFEIAYVVGSDRAEFLYACLGKGIGVGVLRNEGESSTLLSICKEINAIRQNAVLPVLGIKYAHSSSAIRKRPINWVKGSGTYFIRDDLPEQPHVAKALKLALETVFFEEDVQVEIIPLHEQQTLMKLMKEDYNSRGIKILSLDPFVQADAYIKVSRVFQAEGNQDLALRLEASPEAEPLEVQINKLMPGNYVLVDDDIVSGFTIEAIRAKLPPYVHICDELSLLNQWWYAYKENYLRIYDVLDARDFIPDVPYGGLVLDYRTTVYRNCYLSLDVNLATRAKIPPHKLGIFLKVLKQHLV